LGIGAGATKGGAVAPIPRSDIDQRERERERLALLSMYPWMDLAHRLDAELHRDDGHLAPAIAAMVIAIVLRPEDQTLWQILAHLIKIRGHNRAAALANGIGDLIRRTGDGLYGL
jgi:hypothetical protein